MRFSTAIAGALLLALWSAPAVHAQGGTGLTPACGTNNSNLATNAFVTLCGGPWSNTRLAKTGAYAAVTADCGSTLALGGSAFYTLTINAASGYAAKCVFLVVNEDSGRAKMLAINGIASFKLYPLQSVLVFNDNNVWQLLGKPEHWNLLAAATFFVDDANGNDANDGLAAGAGNAFKTIQNAINVIASDVDTNISNVAVSVAAGTYTGAIMVNNPFLGSGTVTLTGDITTPTNVVISTTGDSVTVQNGGVLYIGGFKLTSSAGSCLSVHDRGVVNTSAAVNFGICGATSVTVFSQATVHFFANFTISGNAQVGFQAYQFGRITAEIVTGTMSGTPAFSIAHIQSIQLGYVNLAGILYSGAATGVRYDVEQNSVIFTGGGGGGFVPGNAAGVSASGGQYL